VDIFQDFITNVLEKGMRAISQEDRWEAKDCLDHELLNMTF